MPFQYDAKAGRLRTALALSNTVLPNVISSTEFWLFLGFHVVTFVGHRSLLWEDTFNAWQLDWTFVKVITAMTTFFEVFYANQCYARYLSLYRMTRGTLKEALAYATILRTYIRDGAPGYARLSLRYIMVAVLLHFQHIEEGSVDPIARLERMGVLKRAEAELLRLHSSDLRVTIVLSWAISAGRYGCEAANAPNSIHRSLLQSCQSIKSNLQDINDTLALPVPFQYFHLLSVMIIMNLALWAYGMGCSSSPFAPVVFFFAALIFIGMMELSSELSDPFGNDEVDFPVEEWVQEYLDIMHTVFEQHSHDKASVATLAEREVPLRAKLFQPVSMPSPAASRGVASKEVVCDWPTLMSNAHTQVTCDDRVHAASSGGSLHGGYRELGVPTAGAMRSARHSGLDQEVAPSKSWNSLRTVAKFSVPSLSFEALQCYIAVNAKGTKQVAKSSSARSP